MNAPITIIIADDHAVYLEGLNSVLQTTKDIKVVAEAHNGEDLVQRVKKFRPDVVLTDIIMPLKDGIAATKEIIEQYPATNIIALSVSDEDSYIIDMIEAGASGYLLKNSEKHEIVDAIHTVYKHGTYYCKNTTNKLSKIILKSRSNSYHTIKQPVLNDLELKIITLLCQEKTSKEIATELFISCRTVESWRMKIEQKLGVRNTPGIIIYAIKTGIFKIDLLAKFNR